MWSSIQVFTLVAILTGCATRSVPDAPPPGAPSSPAAKEAPLADVTVALTKEPPFGEAETATATDHHRGHHHDH